MQPRFRLVTERGGDGNESAATLTSIGTHSWAVVGSDDFTVASIYNPSIEIDVNRVDSADASATLTVTDPYLTLTTSLVSVTSGDTFNGTVATFMDDRSGLTTGDLTATIDWGDGSDPVSGTVVSIGVHSFAVTATYSASTTENLNDVIAVADTSGSAATAEPPLVANINTSSGAVEGQTFSLGLSLAGVNAGEVDDWVVDWGDGSSNTTIAASATVATHGYADSVAEATITAYAMNGATTLQTVMADPLKIVPADPSDIQTFWDAIGPTLSLTFMWQNNSEIASGLELDEISPDGLTTTVIDSSIPATATLYTIAPADPDSQATYDLRAYTSEGAYSDPRISVPLAPVPLTVVSVTSDSATFSYDDPTSANLVLYERGPDDLNMSANTAYTLNTSSGSQTFTVDGLYADESYYFSIDAFNDEQDAKCIPVEVTPTSSTPTSAGVTIDDAEWMSSFPSVTVTGYSGPSDGVWVVFDSPSYCEPLLVETRGDDPFRMFYQNFVSGDTGGQGGQIPPVYVKTVVAATMSVPGTYEAYYPVFANNQDVGLQLTDGAQLSNQVECAIGAYSGNAYPIPTPPTLSATTDLGGDLVVTYTAGTHYGSSSTPTPYSNFYAIVDGTPVQMTRGTDYTDAGAGTMTVPATSEYAGDPVFAAFADELDGAYHDSQPYWSGESNIVGAGESGAPNAPTNLIAKGINLTSAFLHWTDNSDDESGFTIYMTFPTLTGVSWLQMGTTGSDADNFTVTVAELNNALGGQFFMYLPSNLLVEVVANNAAGPSIGNPIATVSMCPVDDNLFDRLNSDILGIAANAVHANTSLQNDIHFLQRVNFVFTQLSVNAILSQLFTSLTTDTAVAVAAVALTPEAEVAALEGAELIALWQVLQIEIPLMINSYYGDEIKSFQTDLIADSSNLAKVYTLIAGLLKASPGICNYTAFQGLQKYILQDQSTIKNDLLAS